MSGQVRQRTLSGDCSNLLSADKTKPTRVWWVVELQGIEPWSREDDYVRSTCLVDFDFCEAPGRQQPSTTLVTVFSTAMRNNTAAQFKLSTPRVQTRRTEVWAMMASTDLISG
jgi:hypothetical protein